MRPSPWAVGLLVLSLLSCGGGDGPAGAGLDAKATPVYARIRAAIDAVPAIDNHAHLTPIDRMRERSATPRGLRPTLRTLWATSYLPYLHRLPPWPEDREFDTWWSRARDSFEDARANGFYRYLLPAFRDLYDVDFETITDEQARALNERIETNYADPGWVRRVVVERANIEMVLVDPVWSHLHPPHDYDFVAPAINVREIVKGSHPAQVPPGRDNPYEFAREHRLPVRTLDDYECLVEQIVAQGAADGAVFLKSSMAYERTLAFERVSRERAAEVFGRPPDEITERQQKDFEDYVMWRLCDLAARYQLPFQFHTGRGRLKGSNPLALLDLIDAHPKTRFVILHGGYPWIGEAALLAQTGDNVWVDASWLPMLSYTMAKRAFKEWLESVQPSRILWGTDCYHAEGIYGAAAMTRRCLSEALAEKVIRGELDESHAIRYGKMIMRDNALAAYPRLPERLGPK